MADNNMHNSDVKDIQKDVSFLNAQDIRCVICAKKLKTEKNIKTHDLKYHIKKESAMSIPVNIVVDQFWPK